MRKTATSFLIRPIAGIGIALLVTSIAMAQLVRPGQNLETRYSFSGKSNVTHDVKLGETSAQYYEIAYTYGFRVGDATTISAGLDYERSEFDTTELFAGRLALPDRLETKALSLAAEYRIDQSWGAMLMTSPGYRGANGTTSGKAFTVPVILGGSYARSKDLVWLFGVVYDEFAQYRVLPVSAVMWNFSADWTLSIGFPRTGITYQASKDLKLFANVSMEGGSYFVKGSSLPPTGLINPGEPPYPPSINNTYLEYREVRVGLGLEYSLGGGAIIELEGGAVANRRWDYHKINYTFYGKSSAFGQVAMKFAF